jgi:hypothetical protein
VPRDEFAEGPLLYALAVEVLRPKPRFEAGPDRRPLAVGDRIPGGVAVSALDHHVVAEDALEAKPEALGGAARGGVQRVAFPLEPAIAEVVEYAAGEQVDGFRRGCGPP